MQLENETHNSTDATRGFSLRIRVESRKQELEQALASLPLDDHGRESIVAALDAVAGLMTGDLDAIPNVVAVDLNRWLERNKHVNERHDAPEISRPETD